MMEIWEHFINGVGLYLSYYNAGGFSFNTAQLNEYVTAWSETIANKTKD